MRGYGRGRGETQRYPAYYQIKIKESCALWAIIGKITLRTVMSQWIGKVSADELTCPQIVYIFIRFGDKSLLWDRCFDII